MKKKQINESIDLSILKKKKIVNKNYNKLKILGRVFSFQIHPAFRRYTIYRNRIAVIKEYSTLFPEFVLFEVRKMQKDEADKKIDKALSMVSLQGFAARMPGQLSGGQQQRVAVARSLVFDPQLVLMDEPLGALDKNLRESMQYEIKHIHESIGVTVVYVTHDQSEALTMACLQVMGSHNVISMAGTQGHFELNAFKPVIGFNIINSINLLSSGVANFCDKCLKGIKPNLRNIKEGVENSLMLVTALAPEIGYEKAAELAKLAHKKNITLIEANKILKYIDVRKMKSLLNPSKMISSS